MRHLDREDLAGVEVGPDGEVGVDVVRRPVHHEEHRLVILERLHPSAVQLGREVVNTRPRCATLALGTLKAAITQYRANKVRAEIDADRSDS